MSDTQSEGAVYPSLRGRSVMITGGATGIGASMVECFTEQGCKVGFIDIDEGGASKLCTRLGGRGLPVPSFQNVDVTDVEALRQSIANFGEEAGGIDILVNNVANDQRHEPLEVSEEYWRSCLSVNLDSAFFATQAVIPMMQKKKKGSIINFSSINALIGPTRMPGYVSSKAALLGLTKAMARNYGSDGIRVNVILPGWVVTERQLETWLTEEEEAVWMEQMSLKERITPRDVARLALFLGSDESSKITNQQFVIDGGRT